MKPPKTIRNFVHTLLGTKKRNKASAKSSLSLAEPNVLEFELDKGRRHHRSADDLLDESFEDPVRLSSTASKSRSRTLPRRSQSSASGQRPSVVRRYESSAVRDTDFEHELQLHKNAKNVFRPDELKYSRDSFQTSAIPRSTSLNAVWNKGLTKRSQSYTPDAVGLTDEGYDDFTMPPRTTSWSHPRNGTDFQIRRDGTRRSQREIRNDQRFFRDEKLRSSASKFSQRTSSSAKSSMRRSGERFSSHDHFLQDPSPFRVSNTSSARQSSMTDDRISLRTSSRASSSNSNVTADMKMKTCLDVLNRLSARVKEIKEVSRRVEKVGSEVKNGTLPVEERERRLMELDMAEAASARLKSILKSDCVGETAPGRLNSHSSGYNSIASSRRGSDSSGQAVSIRTCRPLDRRPRNDSYDTALQPRGNARQFYDDRRDPQFPPSGPYIHAPYPMSVSDMMPLWDTKEIISQPSKERLVTREDSMSSGYATGSGSEDGRHGSPLANDTDSVMSVYSMNIPALPYNTQPAMSWHNQQYYRAHPYNGYGMEAEQDPYAVYGTYHPVALTGNEIDQESVYGNYGQIHGYASSSLNDQEIYSNGWYQLPADQPGANVAHQHYGAQNGAAIMPKVENAMQMNAFHPQWSSVTSYPVQTKHKYGGLEDIFYDPTATPAPSIMENIAGEVVRESQTADEQTWKSYGSFRYRNGQKMVLPCNSNAARKRKTVRFSQTVRQRIETEESEMEDSTSVIKGGEDNESANATKTTAKSAEESSDPSSIYMSPREPITHNNGTTSTTETASATQKPLPEPIYEFPTGHIESSCMCGDCILARGSCQMQSAQVTAFY